MTTPSAPELIVQRQLDAYNARDIDALLATYAPDARQFEHPGTLVASGAAAMRARMALRFAEPNLHARLLQRVVMGNIVIDHEEVTRTFPEGAGWVDMVAIYEVVEGKIVSASVQVSNKRLA
ncbi:MAG: nuclear transport factor 2 family protein [Pseudomonadota bacterium]|nr:nuclear transport factor 2 family protein [Pseudomonadota bacterium]